MIRKGSRNEQFSAVFSKPDSPLQMLNAEAEPTSFVRADGAGGGGPDALGVDHLDGDGVAREGDEAVEVDAPRLGVVQHDLLHILLRAAGVLMVLPVELNKNSCLKTITFPNVECALG